VTAVLPDPATDPTGYVLAVADLREARIEEVMVGPYQVQTIDGGHQIHAGPDGAVWLYIGDADADWIDAEHISAEANPAHARAEVALWRAVANLPHAWQCYSTGQIVCDCPTRPTLDHAVAAARAYLDGQ
jgi:hypothetical protein